jgi:hypothetical protein
MVMEAFYGNNTTVIARNIEHPLCEAMNVIRYPPASVASYVRQLRYIDACSGDMCMRKMLLFAKIGDGTLGSKNLRTLDIIIGGCANTDNESTFNDALRDFPPMAFPTRQLRIEYSRWECNNTRRFGMDDTVAPLLEKFTLQAGRPVYEMWTRFYRYMNDERFKNVKEFPAPERDSDATSIRCTVKEMALRSEDEWYKGHY